MGGHAGGARLRLELVDQRNVGRVRHFGRGLESDILRLGGGLGTEIGGAGRCAGNRGVKVRDCGRGAAEKAW